MRNNKSGAMIFVRDKNVEPGPAAVVDVSDDDDDKMEPGGKTASTASTQLPKSAGGDSARLDPVTSDIVASKRI
eukprot:359892-Karenia_brevis.AAC.1